MKKLLSISFALILIVSMFSACSNGEEKATGKKSTRYGDFSRL